MSFTDALVRSCQLVVLLKVLGGYSFVSMAYVFPCSRLGGPDVD
jgi:hypothetical protein